MQDNLKIINSAQKAFLKLFDLIINQKLGATVDYTKASLNINELLSNIAKLEKVLQKEIIVDKNTVNNEMVEYVYKLGMVTGQLLIVTKGLKNKAENIAPYGFFEYRRDLKALKKAQKELGTAGLTLNKYLK